MKQPNLIKPQLSCQGTAIIALTATTLEEERTVILSFGCNDFICKPLPEADILSLEKHESGAPFLIQREYSSR